MFQAMCRFHRPLTEASQMRMERSVSPTFSVFWNSWAMMAMLDVNTNLEVCIVSVHMSIMLVLELHTNLQQGWESSGLFRNVGFLMVPRIILEICLYLGRKFVCVYIEGFQPEWYISTLFYCRDIPFWSETFNMYFATVSCWCRVLQSWSHLLFYSDSVCPELALRHTVWKWPSATFTRSFYSGLQARFWHTKIGLQSFVMRFSQAAH